MRRWLLLGILVVVAFWLGYVLSRASRPGGEKAPTASASFLIHVYGEGNACKAVVGPKRGNAFVEGEVTWDLRNDCAGQTVSTWEVTNFRPKGNVDCAQDQTTGNPNDSPIESVGAGAGDSKHSKVKKDATHGQPRLAYCYDVNVTVGNARPIKADPEMDIMQ